MNREIKFRSWDKDNKEFQFWSIGGEPELFSDKDIVMQYTGLKDKNGKEIYEGDIVEHTPLNQIWEIFEKEGAFWGRIITDITGEEYEEICLLQDLIYQKKIKRK